MERRKFTCEFKVEVVKLIQERGVTVAQAAWDLGVRWYGVASMGTEEEAVPIRREPFRARDR
jgi:transposase